MDHATPLTSLVAVSIAAFLVPLVLGMLPRVPIPAIVGEVLAGIALGASWLGVIGEGELIDFLFLFGLAFLLFLAGFEIDFPLLLSSRRAGWRRSPLVLGSAGFLIRIVIAGAIGLTLAALGIVNSWLIVAVLLVSTSLGIVLAVLKEDGETTSSFGQAMLVSTAIADLGTVLLLTVLFSTEGRSPSAQLSLVALQVTAALLLFAILRFAGRVGMVADAVRRLSGATSQIRVRGSLALLVILVGLASELGLELILGAFLAGAIMSALTAGHARTQLTLKLDAVGYGFFVPVFFVLAGSRVDIGRLVSDTDAFLLVPILTVGALLVKVPAALVFASAFGVRTSLAAGFLQSAQLTLTVAGVEIGERLGLLSVATGSALIIVALLTVVIAPLLYGIVRRPQSSAPVPT